MFDLLADKGKKNRGRKSESEKSDQPDIIRLYRPLTRRPKIPQRIN